jgi:hypothetical protein
MDLADFNTIFHPTSAQYTFFSATHGNFSKIDHIFGTEQASANIKNRIN